MNVSVIVCTYAEERFEDFLEAVQSLQAQTYDNIEIVLVIDGNETIHEWTTKRFDGKDNIVIHCNDKNHGISASRTRGVEIASGDVVAFIDDDAIANEDWVETLVKAYQEHDAIAVGGQMVGEWIGDRPWFLPQEFNWLVGVTHRGFGETGSEVRNTFESNLSFRRDVFLDLGGFDPKLGPTAEEYRHSEGAEIGVRLKNQHDSGVLYIEDAIVKHKIFKHRTKFIWLCQRAFKQGVSKRTMAQQSAEESSVESAFLYSVIFQYTPLRVRRLVRSPTISDMAQLFMLFFFTGLVGAGYLFEVVRTGYMRD